MSIIRRWRQLHPSRQAAAIGWLTLIALLAIPCVLMALTWWSLRQ